MDTFQTLEQKWEARLPALDDPWTHWQLDGEGFVIGLFSWQELGKVIRTLKENHTRFSSIYAQRAQLDEIGTLTLHSHRDQITNQEDDMPQYK